ncbi:UDP-N-acetylglucosamine 1-carboxyvinyltransferase [Candidatus Planktophila sp.]|nr:UDP-N-acetylglucosamine 1-carboxyvinyltransferase [Candidatus Planktophila sp.]
MERLRVVGGAKLVGTVRVSGAKNSALKLMAATLLAPGQSKITNLPAIADVEYMAELLTRLGCQVDINRDSNEVLIDVPQKLGHRADYDMVRKLRASINVLGPLIARELVAEVALPGGDAIGSRGLDFHINGLTEMGAQVSSEHGFIIAKAPSGLKGAKITLEFPSVGATENIMTAATLATGITVIDNAAREPDVVDLGEFLISMGAKITGLGSHTITIEGVSKLTPTTHATLADRIVSGTWAFAAAMTQGDITIENGRADHLELPLDKLVEAGAVVTTTKTGFRVKMDKRPIAVDVATLPYPGFPTDLQPMVITLNSIAEGTSIVTENVFEGRFMFVNELLRLGAKIQVDGHHAAITGIKQLSAAPVVATDIRAGAGLVLAALVSDGVTIIEDAFHIDRGYPDFPAQLQSLGADVSRT